MAFSHHRNSYVVLQSIFLIYSSFIVSTTAIDTIRPNQSLRDSEALVSNGGKFKLAFFTPPNSSYRYVGVLYNLPETTVVWVANRNNPLHDSRGTLELSSDGNLVVLNGQNETVWSTNLSNPVANSSVVLLNTGNLVLEDSFSTSYVWESFKHASDSVVEKMKIVTDLSTNETNMLTSWRTPSDPGTGSFTLTVEPVETPELFVWKEGNPYWRSGPWNGLKFGGIPKMVSFYENRMDVDSNSSFASATFRLANSSILLFLVLNASGEILQKMWSYEKTEWEITWSSVDSDCDVYGYCGSSGICDARAGPVCSCFPGYEPKRKEEWKEGNWSGGCTRRTRFRCEGNTTSKGKEDGFVKVNSVKLPDHYRLFSVYEQECRTECLMNCSCAAYAYSAGIGCLHWAENLFDIQRFPSGGDDLYVRLAYSELGNKKDKKAIISTTVILGFSVLAVCSYFLLKWLLRYRARKQKHKQMHGVKLEELPMFRFQMLSNATGKFDLTNKLGQGGFGPVFKGILPNGQEIAVKRLARTSNQGLEEFMNEVEVISRLQHRNLVRLLGCCVESEEKLLVYEYMPSGSLDAYLFYPQEQKFLDWQTRVIIIEGICRGLLYLHRDSRLRIIHRDLKASNILLDEELNPKISDFGMARIFCGKDGQANTTKVVGTYGYMSPEYALRGIFSEKSDVYSFGVLLLEIVSGRRNAHSYGTDEQLFLIAHAWKLWNEEKIVNLMDPTIYSPEMDADIIRYANVGLLCVEETAADRPNISTVLSMLSCEIVDLPPPNQPAFLGIRRSPQIEASKINLNKCSINDVTVTIVEGR